MRVENLDEAVDESFHGLFLLGWDFIFFVGFAIGRAIYIYFFDDIYNFLLFSKSASLYFVSEKTTPNIYYFKRVFNILNILK